MSGPTSEPVTVSELLRLPLFDGESIEAVEWIADRMQSVRFAAGETIIREGEPAGHFAIVLEGEMHYQRSGHDSILVAEVGEPTGMLPFSRMKTWAARGWAAQPVRIAMMEAVHLRELVYRAPVVAQRLVAEMTDRTREFTRMEEGSSRLQALGKLAAGLTHELNNPAAAAVRSAVRLREALEAKRKYSVSLRQEALSPLAAETFANLADQVLECESAPGARIDELERADLESDLSDWLDSVDVPSDLAPALADARISPDALRQLAAQMSPQALALALRTLVADHEILCLSRELEETARRVSDLVQAMKSYSHMDKTGLSDVDIERGIEVTLRMFQHQLKHGVKVTLNFARNLPPISANGGALNQIWTNLIDNAVYAMGRLPAGAERQLAIRTLVEPSCVLVEFIDNGIGIPAAVQGRIFEPFFTTTGVGEGLGLGLDIVQRIVRNHRGSIRFESVPGRTVFQVRLPASLPR